MRDDDLGGVVMLPKSINNSQVVREVDHRANRALVGLLVLVGVLVVGLGLYAWPHLALREAVNSANKLSQDRDRLMEENRKLRLEKASLENLRRVEKIATKRLGLLPPDPERVIVVEPPQEVPAGSQLASKDAPADTRN